MNKRKIPSVPALAGIGVAVILLGAVLIDEATGGDGLGDNFDGRGVGYISAEERAASNAEYEATAAPAPEADEYTYEDYEAEAALEESADEPAYSDEEIGEASFALQVKSDYPADFGHWTDAALADLGNAICGDFDSGMDVYEIAFSMTPDADPVTAAGVVGAAGPALCPENEAEMTAQFENFGG